MAILNVVYALLIGSASLLFILWFLRNVTRELKSHNVPKLVRQLAFYSLNSRDPFISAAMSVLSYTIAIGAWLTPQQFDALVEEASEFDDIEERMELIRNRVDTILFGGTNGDKTDE